MSRNLSVDLSADMIKDPGIKDPGVKDSGVKDLGIKDPGLKDPRIKDPGVRDPELKDPGFKDPGVKDPGFVPTFLVDVAEEGEECCIVSVCGGTKLYETQRAKVASPRSSSERLRAIEED